MLYVLGPLVTEILLCTPLASPGLAIWVERIQARHTEHTVWIEDTVYYRIKWSILKDRGWSAVKGTIPGENILTGHQWTSARDQCRGKCSHQIRRDNIRGLFFANL